jgi:hypothetical protein
VNKVAIFTMMLWMSAHVSADPLFESDDSLTVTITAPFSEIYKLRDKTVQYPARLSWDGSQEMTVGIQVRGNNRLKKSICKYPPLKVYFKKEDVKGTIFKKQSELKMVVACKKKYSQHVRVEYLVYKLFASLSDNSFKVRWLELSFIDGGKEMTSPGFFIEQKKRMGKRLGLTQVHANKVSPKDLDQQSAVIVDLFQFIIGNTDYSNFQSRGKEDCCHNTKLMQQTEIDSGTYIPVPYDFDSSGIVSAEYAVPSPTVSITSVKMRKYRGLCQANSQLPTALALVQNKKEEILSLFAGDNILTKRTKTRIKKYLEKFYAIVDSPKKLDRSITGACRS